MIGPSSSSHLGTAQLLLQLGDRLKRLRKAQGMSAVEMAEAPLALLGNTLRSVESGDPSPSIGTYLRVMSVLGVGGESALLAGDTMQPSPRGSAGSRSKRAAPLVRVQSFNRRHIAPTSGRSEPGTSRRGRSASQKENPELVQRAQDTVSNWLAKGDTRSASLWLRWQNILQAGAWRKALGPTHHAQQLRQASPLVTVLTEESRQRVLQQVRDLKNGVVLT